MIHLTLKEKETYTTALIIKESALKESPKYYPIDWDNTIGLSISYSSKKLTATEIKEQLSNIYKICKHLQVKYLFICDSSVFKVITKVGKAESQYGSVLSVNDFNVILCPNYQILFYDPKVQAKIDLAVNTLLSHIDNKYIPLGSNIIQTEHYPESIEAIQEWLQKLQEHPKLTCDIETEGLVLSEAELVSIAFAWSSREGVAFPVTQEIKPILKNWFKDYKGTLIFHNATFDVTNLIYRLFMKDYLDYSGLMEGLDSFTIEDTKIIAYLATNSTAGNELSLKKLALEFAGNYAILDEESIIKNIPIKELLKYNLIDCLSTWYVYDKYRPIMIQDDQLKIYEDIMLPSLKSIIHMQLIGFPMDIEQINVTANELNSIQNKHLIDLEVNPIIEKYEWELQKEAFVKKNKELKIKYISIDNFKTKFNPNSGIQLSKLLYEYIGLDIINTTDKGLPATDKDTLQSLYNQLIQQYNLSEEELK